MQSCVARCEEGENIQSSNKDNIPEIDLHTDGIITKEFISRERRESLVDYFRLCGRKSSSNNVQSNYQWTLSRRPELLCSAFSILGPNSRGGVRPEMLLGRLIVKRTCMLDNIFQQQNLQNSRSGITCICFDGDGVLFAVCSSNGCIRIYDFDECLYSIQLGETSVRNLVTPVVTIDTRNRRNVSDIAWSTLEVDHVAVAFRTQPHVYVYDLKTPLEPLFVFELGKEGGGGNTKIMFMESKFTSLRNGRRYEKLVTGSTSGTLRLWSMNSITYKRVDWEINLDPHTSHPSPVVGLVALHRPDGDGILALSRNGICTIWNSSALSVKTFGSEKTPLCLLRISLWDDIFRPKFGNHINPLPIIGICSLKSNVVYPDNTLGITIGNGDVVIFDIMSQTILSSSFMNAAEYSSRQLTIIGNALIPPSKSSASSSLSLDVPSANASTAYSCNAIFPSWPGAWCCVGRNGTNKLQFIDFLTSLQPPPLHESSKQDTMRKTFQNCFTLPGHIVSIDSTGCKITVSDDLSQYLTTSTMAGSLPSRSCSVCFDWHVAEENASISHYSGVKGIVYTLEDVRNRTLLLSEPYEGPPVSCGNPRVYIKTNLVSVTTPDNPSTNSTTFMQSRVFKSIAASDQVTALAQHSFLPFIVAGLADGTVLIFGQGAGVDD